MNMTDCFLSLERLISGHPRIVKGYYKINNDTVAIEAGLPRGSIKKHNKTHELLIKEISKYYGKEFNKAASNSEKLKKSSTKVKALEKELNDSLAREALMIKRIIELEVTLKRLSNVRSIRTQKEES